MSMPDLKHLFVPGDGNVPPYLAGRKKEQSCFQDCVEVLKNRKPARQNLIFYGPRGNGKTALLNYLKIKTLQKEASKLDILWVTPNEMETLTELANRLTENHQTLRKRFKSAEISGGVGGLIQAKTEMDLSPTSATIRKLVQERSRNKPFILIIDEAHRLKPEVAESLLNTSQTVRLEGSPFLLTLAGTPNLRASLGQANASFWDRSEIIRLGRLSPEEAHQAITIPLQEAGIAFAPGVIENIVEQTHCYPFFTQIWGDSVAQRLQQTGERVVSMETVKTVQPTVTDKYNIMYQIRRNEIDDAGLLLVAESIANAFMQSGEAYLHERGLKKAIAQGMTGDESITDQHIREKLKQLSHLGYIWQSREGGYEPGIPSLLSYVGSQAQMQEISMNNTRSGNPVPSVQTI